MTYWFANLSELKYITDLIIWLTTTYHTYLWNVLYWEFRVRSKWIHQKYYSNYACHPSLQVGLDATPKEIKKKYREMSLIYHPDKPTGNEKLFMKLTKAYDALTDDTAR